MYHQIKKIIIITTKEKKKKKPVGKEDNCKNKENKR
jgi:hypothetical protein